MVVSGVPSSYVHLGDPTRLEFEYVRWAGDVIDVMAADGEPVHTVHIGGAGCTLARYVAATRPRSRQIVLDDDPAVIELARETFGYSRRSGFRLREGDGLEGLRPLEAGHFDLVIRDAFAGDTTPAHLTTTEFVGQVARVLAADGAVRGEHRRPPGAAAGPARGGDRADPVRAGGAGRRDPAPARPALRQRAAGGVPPAPAGGRPDPPGGERAGAGPGGAADRGRASSRPGPSRSRRRRRCRAQASGAVAGASDFRKRSTSAASSSADGSCAVVGGEQAAPLASARVGVVLLLQGGHHPGDLLRTGDLLGDGLAGLLGGAEQLRCAARPGRPGRLSESSSTAAASGYGVSAR